MIFLYGELHIILKRRNLEIYVRFRMIWRSSYGKIILGIKFCTEKMASIYFKTKIRFRMVDLLEGFIESYYGENWTKRRFINRVQTSVQNFIMLFLFDNLHIIWKPTNVKHSIFQLFNKSMFNDMENSVFWIL